MRQISARKFNYWVSVAGIALSYAVVTRTIFKAPILDGIPPEAWLPSGIGLGVLIAGGVRFWPGIMMGSVLALWLAGLPATSVAGISLANTAAAVLGAELFSRGGWRPTLDRFRDLWGLLFVALLDSGFAAVLGTSFLNAPTPGIALFAAQVAALWAGHLYSDLLFLPLLLGFAVFSPTGWTRQRWVEFATLIGLKIFLEMVTHAPQVPNPIQLGLVASVFPLMVWAASRFNLLAIGLIVALTLGLGMVGTANGTGPIGNTDPAGQWMALIVFAVFCSAAGVTLNAAIETMRRMQIGLRQSEQRLRDIADSASDFFWEMAELWNHIDKRTAYRSLRLPVVTAAGESRVLQASGKPIFDELGCFRGYRGACSDITEQIIASENLIQAQKMETVGQLTGGIAHDFNNLLAVIIGNLELAKQPSTTGPAQRIVIDRAANAAERGAALVQRLLAFSRRRALSP